MKERIKRKTKTIFHFFHKKKKRLKTGSSIFGKTDRNVFFSDWNYNGEKYMCRIKAYSRRFPG